MRAVVFADLVGICGIFERLGDETAGRSVTQLTAALSKTFEEHSGPRVKLHGDDLFVVFPAEADALRACVAIQKRLLERPVHPAVSDEAVCIQMGLESGEVVEIEGDCYGDAVNSAARLADLADAERILTTQRVREALEPDAAAVLRSLGPRYPRGKSEATEVYRVEWQTGREADVTVMGAAMDKPARLGVLEIVTADQTRRQAPHGERLTLGVNWKTRASCCKAWCRACFVPGRCCLPKRGARCEEAPPRGGTNP